MDALSRAVRELREDIAVEEITSGEARAVECLDNIHTPATREWAQEIAKDQDPEAYLDWWLSKTDKGVL